MSEELEYSVRNIWQILFCVKLFDEVRRLSVCMSVYRFYLKCSVVQKLQYMA